MSSDTREIKEIPTDEAKIPTADLKFFCKKCEILVDAKQTKKQFTFSCPTCGKTEIAFGTEESIRNHYRIRE